MSRRSLDGLPGEEAAGDLQDRLLSHAEDDEVGLGVEQDRPLDGVAPVVVMSEPTERRLDPSGDDRHAGERLAGPLAVGERGAVGPQADPAAGAVGVVVADLLVGRVVVDHAVHVPRADGEEQARPAEGPPRLGRLPVRLAPAPPPGTRPPPAPGRGSRWRTTGDRRRHPRSRRRRRPHPIPSPPSPPGSPAAGASRRPRPVPAPAVASCAVRLVAGG